MPWEEKSIMLQREEFIRKALQETVPFTHLCESYGISRTIGYRLLKRYHIEGLKGLEDRSKANFNHPNKTKPSIEDAILKLRDKHDTWGARKIYAYLTKQNIKDLPAISTITEILKRNGYISKEASLKRQALTRFEREMPNDLWQMDFKGHFKLKDKQSCYPLTTIDDHSRFSLCLKVCVNEALMPVKMHLTHTFNEYGLPIQINVDNGPPWGNSCLVRYTALTVWWMQLGIIVSHSRPRHPQTNGKNERFHRTLKEDVLNKGVINNLTEAQELFDIWRHIYNNERPHQGIGMSVPADRYQPSPRPMPNKLPTIEYDSHAIVKKISHRHYVRYKGHEYLVGKAFIGHYIELRPCETKRMLEVYFGKNKIYTYNLE